MSPIMQKMWLTNHVFWFVPAMVILAAVILSLIFGPIPRGKEPDKYQFKCPHCNRAINIAITR